MAPELVTFHLDRVSRSFSFCIARLEEPLRYQVGMSYLICRILDSIEDAKWASRLDQMEAFDCFLSWLDGSRIEEIDQKVERWMSQVHENFADHELALLRDAKKVFSGVQSLPDEIRSVIIPSVTSMALGMKACLSEQADPSTKGGLKLKLQNLAEVNRYCFFVAGVVGELLTGLLRRVAIREGVELKSSVLDSFRFGLFLQKVNIIKDRKRDLEEGRDFVPSTNEFVRSAFDDLKSGFRYLQSIPTRFHSYRLFCAWSLFLGMESLKASARGLRVSRTETALLIARVEFALRDQDSKSLVELFDEIEVNARQAYVLPLTKSAVDDDTAKGIARKYTESYRGSASESELLDLARLA